MRSISLRILLAGLIVLTNTAKADTIEQACEKLVQDQQKLIKATKLQISQLKEKSALQDQIISDQQKKLESPLKDPLIVGLGAIVLVEIIRIAVGKP